MKDKNWIHQMKNLSEIRLFCSLTLKKARKGAAATAQEVDLLFRAALAKQPVTPRELSHSMGVSKTIISRLIEGLTEKELIQRLNDRKDGRSYSLKITDKGKEELDSMYYYYLAPLYEMQEVLDEAEFQQLMHLIQKVNLSIAEKHN